MNMRKNLLAGLAIGVGLAALAGCDNLTRERYEMITVNVDRQFDVEKMIGDPDYRLSGKWHYERPDKHLNVFVHFDKRGVVVRKEWIDAMTNTWDDTQEPTWHETHDPTWHETHETGERPVYEGTFIRTNEQ